MKNKDKLKTAIARLKALDRVREMEEDVIVSEILRRYPKLSVSEKWRRRIGHV
jgi:hypothetical protein